MHLVIFRAIILRIVNILRFTGKRILKSRVSARIPRQKTIIVLSVYIHPCTYLPDLIGTYNSSGCFLGLLHSRDKYRQQKSNNRFMDAHETSTAGYSVVTRPPQDNDTQRWVLRRVGGVYTIRQRSNGRYMDAHESSSAGYSVVTRTAQHNDTQRWVLMPSVDGSYTIQQLSSSRFVDAHETSSADYSVVTRPPQNNDTQRWLIRPV